MPFMTFLNQALAQMKDMTAKYAPTALSPEKRYGKGCVTACALVTMADGEAEASELDMAADFIMGIDTINDYLGVEEANEILALQIGALQKAFDKNAAMFTMEVNKMLAEIKSGVESAEWRDSIKALAESMASSNSAGKAGPDEQKMLDKIENAIG